MVLAGASVEVGVLTSDLRRGGQSRIFQMRFLLSLCTVVLLAFLTSCHQGSFPSLRANSTPDASVRAKVAVRYAELNRLGTPEKITEEFSREDLIRNAEYLFEHSVTHGNLKLYSDLPFDREKGLKILKEAERRLSASPIYDKSHPHLGFVCNTEWRSEYFMQGKAKYGGLNYFSIVPHVFFARSRVDDDMMLSPQNRPIAPPRTFTYYVVHEFSHSVVSHLVREKSHRPPPKWLSEGYPDYLALGPGFTFEMAMANYKNRDPRVHGTMAEEYMLYDILTANYLEREGMTIEALLADPPGFDEAKNAAFAR